MVEHWLSSTLLRRRTSWGLTRVVVMKVIPGGWLAGWFERAMSRTKDPVRYAQDSGDRSL